MYWDINKILPYQRNFNFINGARSIGKTYGTQKFMIKRFLDRDEQFVYLVRTKSQKKEGIFGKAFEKVVDNEYPGYEFKFTMDTCFLEGSVAGFCIALSEAVKNKLQSFPGVRFILFDEYTLETNSAQRYVNGEREPDLFLNIYHTIDREEDRVTAFLLGNNISFYNPYHLHRAFSIPDSVKPGTIWYSENVLFQWAEADEEMTEKKKSNRFLRMLDGTTYGQYAKEGAYIFDNTKLIAQKTENARLYCTLEFDGHIIGVWFDYKNQNFYLSDKYNESCPLKYALTMADLENNRLAYMTDPFLRNVTKYFRMGRVYYETMEIKSYAERAMKLLI